MPNGSPVSGVICETALHELEYVAMPTILGKTSNVRYHQMWEFDVIPISHEKSVFPDTQFS